MKSFALAGNPNSGKTTLFNILTGSNSHVGNWPGVTVDKREGIYKKALEPISIVDLPGIYSLSPYTPEELIARNYIIDGSFDCVINIIDATNLERNLYLTTQLLEMDVPIVVALNMMDVIKKEGKAIDINLLSKELGVPVIDISAQKGENIDKLIEIAFNESLKPRKATSVLMGSSLDSIINKCKDKLIELKTQSPVFHATKLLENDEIEVKKYQDLIPLIDEFKRSFSDETFGNDLEAVIADLRYKHICTHYIEAKTSHINEEQLSNSDKIDKILTHKWFGIPIFLLILFLIFHLTFSENLFYLGGLFKDVTPSFADTLFEGLLWTENGINSPGIVFTNFTQSILELINNFASEQLINTPHWVNGLLIDGVLAGILSVLSFVPQILFLFLAFSILEDFGYMARIAFMLDRIFRKLGLSGRAFLPMIMGFGCSVPAMINTRTLKEEKERVATIRVIPFFSCGAKLPILTAIAGAICSIWGFNNIDLITFSMYVVGMLTAIITLLIMNKTTLKGKSTPFIMELPQYHLPKFKSLMLLLWDKLKHYIEKAFTIILASTIVIWFLQSFTINFKYIEQQSINDICEQTYSSMLKDNEFKRLVEALPDFESAGYEEFSDITNRLIILKNNNSDYKKYEEITDLVFSEALIDFKEIINDENYKDASDSILAGIGKIIQPIFTPLGFGSQLDKNNGWVFGVASITGLIAKENVIATLTVLAEATTDNIDSVDEFEELYYTVKESDGVNASIQIANATKLTNNLENGWAALISFILFNMTTIPCFAAVATAKAELSNKRFITTIIFWLITSYLLSMAAYLVLSYWWTIFVYMLAFSLISILIYYLNKNKKEDYGKN